jgi:hypothetical protein
VSVPVVDIWVVRMAVTDGFVGVPMRVRFAGRRRRVVRVAMMLVVLMSMLVLGRLVHVIVIVALADV